MNISFLRDQQFILLGMLLILTTVSGWFALQVRSSDKEKAPAQENLPNLILRDVTITQMNTEGHPKHQLQAAELTHIRKKKFTTVKQPHLVIFDPTTQWTVQAEYGEMTGQNHEEQVELRDKVRVNSLNTKNNKTTALETSELTFLPKQQLLKTDATITLLQGRNRLNAQGLRADLKTKQIEFLANVRGYYDAHNQ